MDKKEMIEKLKDMEVTGNQKYLKEYLINYALSLTEEEWKKLKEEAKGVGKE